MTTGGVIALIKALGGSGGGPSGGGVLVVNDVNGTLDKTYAEILASTVPVVILGASDDQKYWNLVSAIYDYDGAYSVVISESIVYATDSASGYPANTGPKYD